MWMSRVREGHPVLGVLFLALLIWLWTLGAVPAEGKVQKLQSKSKPSIPLSMWAWDWAWANIQPAQFEDYAAGLFDLCEKRNVRTIYLGVYLPVPHEKMDRTQKLLERAHQRRIRVEACPEDRTYQGISWARPGGEQGAYDFFDRLIAFNESHPRPQQFDGANLDVEELTPRWLEVLRVLWESKVKRLKQLNPRFTIGAWATPACWWGREEEREKYIYRLQHYTDYVSVGSYFQGDRTLNFFTGPSKPALEYAGKNGKKIYLGLEVSVWMGEGHYYPGWEYMSFASLGETELRYRIDRINAALGRYPGFGGVVIESYDAYRRLCLIQDEIERDSRLYGSEDSRAQPFRAKVSPVSLKGFALKEGHGSEDPRLKTRIATFEAHPALAPGWVLSLRARFGHYNVKRYNRLTEEYVPKELLWLGFREKDSDYRCFRIDYNGAIGLRSVNRNLPGLPGDAKDILRISFRRFAPEPDKTYEFRLYFFADHRVMLKVIDPKKGKVVWHSERMACLQEVLSRMYVEVVDEAPWGEITFDESCGVTRIYQGDAVFATFGGFQLAALSRRDR